MVDPWVLTPKNIPIHSMLDKALARSSFDINQPAHSSSLISSSIDPTFSFHVTDAATYSVQAARPLSSFNQDRSNERHRCDSHGCGRDCRCHRDSHHSSGHGSPTVFLPKPLGTTRPSRVLHLKRSLSTNHMKSLLSSQQQRQGWNVAWIQEPLIQVLDCAVPNQF